MSTVNLAEVLILCEDRQPQLAHEMKDMLLSSSIRFVPPTVEHAALAAEARIRYPLNLGDCFAYALAKEQDVPVLTLDTDFRKTDLAVLLP
jgi:ribonuclease VapC